MNQLASSAILLASFGFFTRLHTTNASTPYCLLGTCNIAVEKQARGGTLFSKRSACHRSGMVSFTKKVEYQSGVLVDGGQQVGLDSEPALVPVPTPLLAVRAFGLCLPGPGRSDRPPGPTRENPY